MFDLKETWVEILFALVFILGFIIAINFKNVFLVYLITFLIGMIYGRLFFYRKRNKHTYSFPFYFILSGFFVGYLIGLGYGNKVVVVSLFIIGSWFSYYIHKKGYLD